MGSLSWNVTRCNRLGSWKWRMFPGWGQRKMWLMKKGAERCYQYILGFEDGRSSHEPRNTSSISRSWKRQEKVFSSRAWRMERSSSDTLVFAYWDPCWASVLPNCRKMNFCWFSHIVYPQQGGTRFTNNKNTKTYCKTQGALLNVMWQPGWEGSLGENGYIYG